LISTTGSDFIQSPQLTSSNFPIGKVLTKVDKEKISESFQPGKFPILLLKNLKVADKVESSSQNLKRCGS
jgi:hypothetical protein